MKISIATRAAALLELRRRRAAAAAASATNEQAKAEEPRAPELTAASGLKRYCELVTPSWNWEWPHLRAIDAVLDKVTSGEIKRLIIVTGTRIGKTEKVTVRYPSMRLELDPATNVIVTGYNDKYARRLSRKILRIVRHRVPLSIDKQGAGEWETAAGGGLISAGVGVGIAGLPADLIIIDDPTKNKKDAYSKAHRDTVWEWYQEDVYTRLEPTGAIVITAARRHEDDLIGRILASEDADSWTVLHMPALSEGAGDPLGRAEGKAICPDRFDEASYAKMRRVLGEASFSAMQQGRPAPASGLIFQADWMRYYTTADHPIIEDGFAVPTLPGAGWTSQLQSWDMSFKDKASSDFVAGHVWKRKGPNCYLVDRKHDRLNFPATIKAVRDMTSAHPAVSLKLVEDKANGPAVISTLESEIAGLVGVEPDGDKVARANAVTAMWEAGNVWLPHPAIAPWVKAFVLEHLQFPLGVHDDDVDAGTQALRRFQQQIELEERRKEFEKRQQGSASYRTTRM